MRERRSGLASRIDVLETLERSHEGLETGVREVFQLVERPEPGPWGTVLGLLAQFLTVAREYAPLIDLALGERAQHFLVADATQLEIALKAHTEPFSGRVSFLPVDLPADGTAQISKRAQDAGAGSSAQARRNCGSGRRSGELRSPGVGGPAGATSQQHADRERSRSGPRAGKRNNRLSLRHARRRASRSGRDFDSRCPPS